jgi:uncharacterized protein (DUF1684 family)
LQERNVVLQMPDAGVAPVTQDASHAARVVTMVDMQRTHIAIAFLSSAILRAADLARATD